MLDKRAWHELLWKQADRLVWLLCGFPKGGGKMVEVLDKLGQLAKERADSVQRTSEALAGDAEGLLVVAKDSCNFVRLLAVIWDVMKLRLLQRGVPAKLLLQECDLLLNLSAGAGQHLALIDKVWQERVFPSDVAQPIYNEVQEARALLDSLVPVVRDTRERAATPPRISADPDELKQRIRQLDEGGEWVKLSDAVSQMRQGGSQKQE
jgi:hypothetical protein